VVQAILLFLGFFLDPFVITMLVLPIMRPLIDTFSLDPIWFGELFIINMIMGLVTPPVGLNIFYLKPITPDGTTMQDLYSAAIPFALLTLVGLVLVMIFPQIVTWLPDLLYGKAFVIK
jgi:TRAP-type mannitol/chloroaromatic compound transport system permease large subunit